MITHAIQRMLGAAAPARGVAADMAGARPGPASAGAGLRGREAATVLALLAALLLVAALLPAARAGEQAESATAAGPPAVAADEQGRREVMAMLHLPPAHYRADGYGGSYLNDSGRVARRKLARELARQHGLELVSDWPMPVLGIDCYVFALPRGADPARVAEALARDARVEWAQPVAEYRTLGGDPLYAAQPTAMHWHLADLHRVATGRNVTIAVVDSGADDAHPDLVGQLAARENFVDGQAYVAESHGTAVAGIIAARADNDLGIRGVAPGARLLALRACSERGRGGSAAGSGGAGSVAGPPVAGGTGGPIAARCDSFSLAKALNFAILRKPQIINMSLTGPPDRLLERLLDAALSRGIRIVSAWDDKAADGGFPASWPGVVAVSDGPSTATAVATAVQASAPGTGARMRAVLAPGRDIPAPLPGGRFGVVSGSSYAAANVSGLLALVTELRPGATLAVRAGEPLDACGQLAHFVNACVCTCPIAAVDHTLGMPRR